MTTLVNIEYKNKKEDICNQIYTFMYVNKSHLKKSALFKKKLSLDLFSKTINVIEIPLLRTSEIKKIYIMK